MADKTIEIRNTSNSTKLDSLMIIENLLIVIKKQLEFMQSSENLSPDCIALILQPLSESWCEVIEINKNNQDIWDVAGKILEIAQSVQNHHRCRVDILSMRFISLISDAVIHEMCRRSYNHNPCYLSSTSRLALWLIHKEAYDDMLLAVTKNSLSYENPFDTLTDKIKVITEHPLLLIYAIDFYRCIFLMSSSQQQDIRQLSDEMKEFLESRKTLFMTK